jgi:hypothetical protein
MAGHGQEIISYKAMYATREEKLVGREQPDSCTCGACNVKGIFIIPMLYRKFESVAGKPTPWGLGRGFAPGQARLSL